MKKLDKVRVADDLKIAQHFSAGCAATRSITSPLQRATESMFGCHGDRGFCRPFHGLSKGINLFVPAMNRWAIVARPLCGLRPMFPVFMCPLTIWPTTLLGPTFVPSSPAGVPLDRCRQDHVARSANGIVTLGPCSFPVTQLLQSSRAGR